MGMVDEILRDVTLPRMTRVRQVFHDNALPDLAAAMADEFKQPAIEDRITPGMKIAVGVGSRGLADLPELVRVTVAELKARGAEPFVIPAMGSHGGATDTGQTHVLETLGVTEESAGCPIRSSMKTVEIGTLENGLSVRMDALAMEADGIVVINRVKPHTCFTAPLESGLVKMITIGLGKREGAEACHQMGYGLMAQNILDMAEMKIARTRILFGVASVENSHERICRVAVVPAEDIVRRERELLLEAKANMPRIMFNPLDVLVIDEMGKEYSGAGMDPNITGRAGTPYKETSQRVTQMVVLGLTEKTEGNATGMGFADICTRRLFNQIDFDKTYLNHITSTSLPGASVPLIMETDRGAIEVAIKCGNAAQVGRDRLVRIANTLHIEELLISDALLEEAKANPAIEILGEPEDWVFDAAGRVSPF